MGYCSHNNREQKKNLETFSTEARLMFLIKEYVIKMVRLVPSTTDKQLSNLDFKALNFTI